MSTHTHRKYSPSHILCQKDPRLVAANAFEIALELALLGSIEAATKLFTLFEEFSPECKSTWSPGFYFAWEATGLWPDFIPASDRTEEAIHKLEIERVLWKRSTCATEQGLEDLINIAISNGRTDEWGHAILKGEDLKAATDLAAYMNKPEKVSQLIQVFADNFDSVWYRLARSRHIWQYLKDGALARAIGVDPEKLKAFEEEAYATFSERLSKGPQRPLRDLPMSSIIKICNTNTLKNAIWDEMPEYIPENTTSPPTSILNPPAPASEIAALEKKLGLDLPTDYKDFLTLTNGMSPLWNGFHGDPALLPANCVYMTDGTKEQRRMQRANVDIGFFINLKVDWEPLSRVVQINAGAAESKYVWLIPPEDVKVAGERFFAAVEKLGEEESKHVMKMVSYVHAGDTDSWGSWLVCVWSPETLELTNYTSFREYLEVVAQDTANEDILDEQDEQGRLLHTQDIVAYQLR